MKKNKISFILLIIVTLTLLMIPISVNADNSPNISTTEFAYDGADKELELLNVPEDVDIESIIWSIKPEGTDIATEAAGLSAGIGKDVVNGTFTVTVADGELIEGIYAILPRTITIKPVDINEEFYGQTISAREFTVTGELVFGHKLEVTFAGSNNKVGETKSSINTYVITESGVPVTGNYDVTVQEGNLILTAPFVVTTDPESEGILGGGMSAKPAAESAPYSYVDNSSNTTASTGSDTLTTSNTGPGEATEIADNSVPLKSGSTSNIPDNRVPLANETNNILGITLFLAVFMMMALVVIYMVARRRNKFRENIYD